MECPFCHEEQVIVVNSRSSKGKSQIWRRRRCLICMEVFTTHEIIDLSHLLIVKKTHEVEKFSRMKLYSGIFYASLASKIVNRELFIDSITRTIEKSILSLKKKKLTSEELADIVLINLKKKHIPTFLRFLTNCKDIKYEHQIVREFEKYL